MALCKFIFLLRLLVTKKGYIVEIIDGRSDIRFFPQNLS